MKDKKILIIAGVVTVVGLLITCVGALFGGSMGAMITFDGITFEDRGILGEKKVTEEHMISEEIKSIHIDSEFSEEIILEKGNEFKVEYEGESLEIAEDKENKSISIISKEGSAFSGISLNFGIMFGRNQEGSSIKVTVPHDLDNLQITSNMAKVEISNMNIEKLTADMDVGDMNLEDTTIGTFEANLNVGNFIGEGMMITDSLDIQAELGNVELKLVGDSSIYDVQVETELGNIDVENQESNLEQKDKENSVPIKIESELGNLEVKWE